MITTRQLLGLGAAVTIGTLLACANDINAPPDPISAPPDPVRVLTSLEMTPSAFTLAPILTFNQRDLWVRAKDQYGMYMDGGAKSLSSSDASVATVTSTGSVRAVVTAVAPGEAEISASWTIGGVTKTATSRVTVESTEEWSLKLDPAALTLNVGSMQAVQVTVLDKMGNEMPQSPIVDAFTSDRDDVVELLSPATVWASYVDCSFADECWDRIYVLGVAPGEATITAKYAGLSATVTVAVVP